MSANSRSGPSGPPLPGVTGLPINAEVGASQEASIMSETLTRALMAEVFGDGGRAPPDLETRRLYVPHKPEIIGDASERRFTAIASTPDLDRMNSRIITSGMRPVQGEVIPLMLNHNYTAPPVGAIETIDHDARRIVITAHVSSDTVWAAILAGEIGGVSVGIRIHARHLDGDVTIIDDFELIEVSVVAVPANKNARIVTVRSAPMSYTHTPATRRTATTIIPPPNIPDRSELAPSGAVVRSFSALNPLAAPAIHRRGPLHFSLSSVIATRLAGAQLRGVEGEIVAELQRRSYAPVHGDVRIPAGVFQTRALSTNAGSGQSLSPEAWLQSLLDDTASARRWGTLSPRLGFNIISTERETIHVPKRTSVLDAGMIAKDADAPEHDTVFDEDILGPKYCSTTTTIKRSAVRYSDPSADAILTADIKAAMDSRVDDQVLFGNGVGLNIQGLLTQTPAALTINKAGAAIETPDLFSLKSLMTNAWKLDDNLGSLRWAASPSLIDRLRTTSRKVNAGDEWFGGVYPFSVGEGTLLDMMVIQSGRLGVTAGGANQYDLFLILGAMGIIAFFGSSAIDLLIDPYSLSLSGSVRLVAFIDVNAIARDLAITSKIANALAA